MSALVLSQRETRILNCVVESFVQNACPVGSRYLAKKHKLGISPATIRNVMNDLEEMGYLIQPHVSAGRIPTDKGYRCYVDNLMAVPTLTKSDRRLILDNLRKVTLDVYDLFEASSYILGKLSSQLGVVLEPRFHHGIFQKMDLVSISDTKILAVITIKSGLVKTIMLDVDVKFTNDQLNKTSWFINERLSGLSLQEIKETIDLRLTNDFMDNNLISIIMKSSKKLFNFEVQKSVHLGGTHNIVSNPEFSDSKETAKILEIFESKQCILNYFDEISEEKIKISIGEENKEDFFQGCSIISVRYHIGNITGTLGVVGPTRMHYPKIISLVDYMGKILTHKLYANLS